MDNTQNIISLCTGYGGIELGIKRTGLDVRTVAYVEIEAFAVANLVAKIEQGKMDAAPIWSNLKTFNGKPFRDKVHGIIGGYPCQPFSNAGQRKGTEDPRHLFPYICEHIRTIRPLWCFFENVGGHLNLGFDEVYKSLRDLGYNVEAGLFTAAEVGAPHKRERLFILAYSERHRRRSRLLQGKDNIRRSRLPQGEFDNGTELRSNTVRCDKYDKELGNAPKLGLEGQRPQGRKQVELNRTNKELGNSNSQQGRPHTEGRNDETETRSASKELAGTKSTERGRLPEKHAGRRTPEAGGSGRSELAVSNSSRRSEDRQQCELRANSIGESPRDKGNCETCQERQGRWPARPGQPQYEWEEPRTVESGMGRTVNGTPSRVDELRLLGNGVVPQTADLAFKTLWNKIGD